MRAVVEIMATLAPWARRRRAATKPIPSGTSGSGYDRDLTRKGFCGTQPAD
jgi:hypothetical protein